MIKIAITSSEIVERKGTSKATGKPYHLRIQTAHAFTISPEGVLAEYPDKFEILLDAEQAPFARGTYQLSPSSVYVGREGRIEVRPRLVPVAAKAAA